MLGLMLAGLGLAMFAYFSAPVGYQDEKGFHFGVQHSASIEARHARAA